MQRIHYTILIKMVARFSRLKQVEKYQDRATFVHLYGPEPHPQMPGTNFDTGIPWQFFWSTRPQHRNYGDRVAAAEEIVDMIHPEQVNDYQRYHRAERTLALTLTRIEYIGWRRCTRTNKKKM